MTDADRLPIAIELLGLVHKHIASIDKKPSLLESTLEIDTPIVQFCLNFFVQFFGNVVGIDIENFAVDTKEAAVRERLRTADPSIRAVIAQFENACDLYPEVFGSTPLIQTVRQFHYDFVPRLLDRADAWAASATNWSSLKDWPRFCSDLSDCRDRYRSRLRGPSRWRVKAKKS